MNNELYLNTLENMIEEYINKSAEIFLKYLMSDDITEQQLCKDQSMQCLGIAEGITRAIELYKNM